jgi:hypothetical protein
MMLEFLRATEGLRGDFGYPAGALTLTIIAVSFSTVVRDTILFPAYF